MTGTLDLHVLELLIARLCHELIGPVAAVNNGVEVLAEEDADFAADAMRLVGDSARRAGVRLQFYRFAYGFASRGCTAHGGFPGAPPHELARDYFAATRIACEYEEGARALPLEWQKLGCNLLLVGAEALPRGGNLALRASPSGPELTVSGGAAGLTPEVAAAVALACPVAALSARTVHGYFTGLLAQALGCRLLGIPAGPDSFRLAPAPSGLQAASLLPSRATGCELPPLRGAATVVVSAGSRKT
jgi:histidine phosphotransferase ChpT